MKKILSFTVLLLIVATVYSQGVSKMFGLVAGSPQSNQASNGFLFSTDSTGNSFQVKYDFPVTTPGANPANLEMIPYNGKLYGTTYAGGSNNYGTIFEYDPLTGIYSKKYDFGPNVSQTGGGPRGSLLLYNNKFYGLTADYGVNGAGCIFEWDPATNIYSKKYDFTGSGGASPHNSLRLMNGKMYGTTSGGGSTGIGTVFEWDPASNIFTKLLDLNGIGAGTNGWGFYNNVTPYNNKLYCATVRGGLNDYGTLLVIDPSLPVGSNTSIVKHFDASSGGNASNAEMIVYNNKLYGTTLYGGTNSQGTLFEINPAGNVFTRLADFNYTTTGANPQGRLVANGSKFLGLCSSGGANGTGTIYEWDPANPTVIAKKAEFAVNNYDNAVNPGSTLSFINSNFYATTNSGGFVNQGNLFEYNPANNIITKKFSFNAAENGRIPYGRPVLLNGKIYGVCYQGPQEIFGSAYGCIWQFDPSTAVYSRKFIFSNVNNAANGRAPIAAPVAVNNKLYGTTANGGVSDLGVLYEFDPATDVYSKKDMQSIGGSYPIGEPVFYNNKLYGMANANGAGNNGIIYSYDIAGGTLSKVSDVQSAGSLAPSGGFTVYNNKLYGATSGGGANNNGGVIVFDPATNTASTVASFSTALGISISNAPTLYNGKLYMTASAGGAMRGSILQFDPATNNLTKLYDFTTTPGGEGYDPKGELTVSGDKLYLLSVEGTTVTNVLELNPANNTVTKKSTYTSNNFNTIGTHNGLTVVPAFIANGIANTCETYPTVVINASNNNKWVPILNTAGDVVAEIKANGNNLGNVNASMFINTGAVREDGTRHLYADRNLAITVQNTTINGVADIRLYIKTNEFNALKNATNSLGQPSGINTINDIAIFKNDQACSAAFATTSVRLNTTASNYEYGYVLAAGITSFSSFYFARNNFTALPLRLINFTARKQGKNVQLNWKTAEEINCSTFEVEKSTDARVYHTLTTVVASNRPLNYYNATDASPAKGYNYYRLKMIDLDGSYKYSDVIKVNYNEKPGLTLWPNPAGNFLTIPEVTKNDRMVITDAAGKMVMNKTITRQNEPVNIRHLTAGVYILQLYSGGTIIRSKFVKH